jgi:hypothetical protein
MSYDVWDLCGYEPDEPDEPDESDRRDRAERVALRINYNDLHARINALRDRDVAAADVVAAAAALPR